VRVAIFLVRLDLNNILKGAYARQFLTYGVSTVGTMLSGFLLVLILVRLLPAEVYGELVLTKTMLLLVISLAGMGLSQAAVRWTGFKEREDLVFGSVLGGACFTALPATALLIGLLLFFEDQFRLKVNMLLVAAIIALVFSYLLNNEVLNWLRARHQAASHALVSNLRAIQQMVVITAGALLFGNVAGYIYGLAAGEVLFLACSAFFYRGRLAFQAKLLGEMLGYGWPHTLVIAGGVALSYADRFMISLLTSNNSEVAYYDAASIVVVSAVALLARPFNLFLFPAYTRLHDQEGPDATVEMIHHAQRLFLIAGLVIATLLITLRGPLLQLLFPADYSKAETIFAPVAFSALLNGLFMATVAGLYIAKKTILVGVSALLAVQVNIAANWFLIPIYGIYGAALGTAISSFVQLIFGYYHSRVVLPINLPIRLLLGGSLWLGLLSWLAS